MTTTTAERTTSIGGSKALEIAEADALIAYEDLTPFRVELKLEFDRWFVDYRLKNPRMNGGGPHYVLDATTGEIISKRYEQ